MFNNKAKSNVFNIVFNEYKTVRVWLITHPEIAFFDALRMGRIIGKGTLSYY